MNDPGYKTAPLERGLGLFLSPIHGVPSPSPAIYHGVVGSKPHYRIKYLMFIRQGMGLTSLAGQNLSFIISSIRLF